MKELKIKIKALTASEITTIAMNILNYEYNAEVWRQNNLTVKGRKFTGRKGVADIIGFLRNNGVMVQCEVKTLTDSLSQDQIELLTQLHNSGGIALVAYQDSVKVKIKTIFQYLTTNKTV